MRTTIKRADIKTIVKYAEDGMSVEAISEALEVSVERVAQFMPFPPEPEPEPEPKPKTKVKVKKKDNGE